MKTASERPSPDSAGRRVNVSNGRQPLRRRLWSLPGSFSPGLQSAHLSRHASILEELTTPPRNGPRARSLRQCCQLGDPAFPVDPPLTSFTQRLRGSGWQHHLGDGDYWNLLAWLRLWTGCCGRLLGWTLIAWCVWRYRHAPASPVIEIDPCVNSDTTIRAIWDHE